MTDLILSPPSALPLLRRADYDSVIIRFNEFLAGRSANEETVREFFKFEQKTYSARSLALHKVALKAAVNRAFPTHDIRVRAQMDALFKSIKLPKADMKVKEEDLFTQKEIKSILRIAPRHVGLFIQSLYDTGARISEGLSMRYAKTRIEPEVVRCDITGKGAKERVLIMTPKLFGQVKNHFKGAEWYFEHHGKCYTRRHMGEMVSYWGRKATGRRIHPHSMRHSRITHMLDAGMPLAAVSRFAGHSDVTTTLKFYSHNILNAKTITGSGL